MNKEIQKIKAMDKIIEQIINNIDNIDTERTGEIGIYNENQLIQSMKDYHTAKNKEFIEMIEKRIEELNDNILNDFLVYSEIELKIINSDIIFLTEILTKVK